MKRILLCIILIFATTISIFLIVDKKKEIISFEDSLESAPMELAAWLQQKYADPATGRIPSMGLWMAYKNFVDQGKIPSLSFDGNSERTIQWELINDFFASIAITKIAYDPNNTQVFYFCTGEGWFNADASIGAGVWKSIDGGSTWSQLPSTANSLFRYCQDVDVHPITSDLYVSTSDGGLMRSQDGGTTFQKVLGIAAGSNSNRVCDVEFTENGNIFCSTGIFQVGAIYYSDSGDSTTWTKQTGGFPQSGLYRIELATAPTNDSVVYAVACNSIDYAIKGFYKTSDKGTTWDTLPNPGDDDEFARKQSWYNLTMAVDPNDENIIVAGGLHLWRSLDGGSNWQRFTHGKSDSTGYQYVHVDQHAILFRNSDTVYFGNDGGIWKTGNFTDSLPTLYNRNYGYRVTQYYAGDIYPAAGNEIVIGGTQDNGSNELSQTGISQYLKLAGADGGFCAIHYQDPNILFVTKQLNGQFRVINHQYPPDTISNAYLSDDFVGFINPLVMDPNDPDLLYMASEFKGLWRLPNASTANDSAWEQASASIGYIAAIGVSKNLANVVYVGKSAASDIYRIDGANTSASTFAPINCDPNNQLPSATVYCSNIYVDPDDANHILIAYSNYGVENIWESKNAMGSSPTYVNHDGDLPDLPVNCVLMHPSDSDVCYIGTDLGVFYTNDLKGDSTVWLDCNNGLANVRVQQLVYRSSDHTVLAVTHGRGLFTGVIDNNGPNYSITWNERGPLDVGGRTRAIMIDPNDPTGQTIWAGAVSGGLWKTTAVDQLPFVGVPPITSSNVQLNVFPNPVAHNGCSISFVLDKSSNASVSVLDNEGRKVIALCSNKFFSEGNHILYWKPTEPPGIYFILFEAGKERRVAKVVVM